MKIVKIIKAIFALIIILGFYMIITKSYYGVVDENGNKITNMQEILLMEQENNEIQNETITNEEEKIEDVSVSASKENIQEKNTEEIKSKTDTQTKKKESSTTKQTTVQEKQKENAKQQEQVKEQPILKQEEQKQEQNSQVVEKKQETQEKVIEEQKCSDSKHKVSAGNSGKWFNSYDEAVAYYDDLINGYSNQIHSGQITIEEYNKKCPYGYETWSCPYCNKWTLNFYYR